MIMVPDKAAGYLFSLFVNKSSSMAKKKLADALFFLRCEQILFQWCDSIQVKGKTHRLAEMNDQGSIRWR